MKTITNIELLPAQAGESLPDRTIEIQWTETITGTFRTTANTLKGELNSIQGQITNLQGQETKKIEDIISIGETIGFSQTQIENFFNITYPEA